MMIWIGDYTILLLVSEKVVYIVVDGINDNHI